MRDRQPTSAASSYPLVVAIAWFSEAAWRRLRLVAADQDALHERYGQWLADAVAQQRRLEGQGVLVRRVEVDIDELMAWCAAKETTLDGRARSAFVAEKLQRQQSASARHATVR